MTLHFIHQPTCDITSLSFVFRFQSTLESPFFSFTQRAERDKEQALPCTWELPFTTATEDGILRKKTRLVYIEKTVVPGLLSIESTYIIFKIDVRWLTGCRKIWKEPNKRLQWGKTEPLSRTSFLLSSTIGTCKTELRPMRHFSKSKARSHGLLVENIWKFVHFRRIVNDRQRTYNRCKL